MRLFAQKSRQANYSLYLIPALGAEKNTYAGSYKKIPTLGVTKQCLRWVLNNNTFASRENSMPEHDSEYITKVSNLLYELALQASRKQILTFSRQLKTKMLETGISKIEIDSIIKKAFQGYTSMQVFKKEYAEVMQETLDAYLRPSRRQKDIIGRVLVEFACVRPYKKPVLAPDGSNREATSRKEFIKGTLPRPLIRYFLVSVRGTLPEINEFQAKPILFGLENEKMASHKEQMLEIVKEFTTHYEYGKRSTDWSAVYQHPQSQQIAQDILSELLETIAGMGVQRYHKIISNIQSNNKFPTYRTAMDRLIELKDVKQLIVALKKGLAFLSEDETF